MWQRPPRAGEVIGDNQAWPAASCDGLSTSSVSFGTEYEVVESYEVGEQCCDLFFDQALLDASHGRDMLTFKYSSFGLHQVRRHLIAVPRVEVIDTSTIMANLQVWASQLRAPSPATSSMMSMDRLDRVWPLDKACSNGLGGRECTHGRRAAFQARGQKATAGPRDFLAAPRPVGT